MKRWKDPDVWFRGFGASIIGGGATAASAWLGLAGAHSVGIDVPMLNLKAIGIIFVSGALTNVLSYLKQSPLPDLVEVETTTITKTETHTIE